MVILLRPPAEIQPAYLGRGWRRIQRKGGEQQSGESRRWLRRRVSEYENKVGEEGRSERRGGEEGGSGESSV